MSEANKAQVRRHLLEGVSGHDAGVWDDLMRSDFVMHFGSIGAAVHGRKSYQDVLRLYWRAFPDLRIELLHMIAEGDVVAAHYVERGTQTGPWGSSPPTGRGYAKNGLGLYRLDAGLLAEAWIQEDDQAFMDQLGLGSLDLG